MNRTFTTNAAEDRLFLRRGSSSPVSVLSRPADDAETLAVNPGESVNWVEATRSKSVHWGEEACRMFTQWSVAERALKTAMAGRDDLEGTYDINGIRWDGNHFERANLASWQPQRAETEHVRASEMLIRLVARELISLIESSVFEAYDLFLSDNPSDLVEKPENSGLKRLYARRFEKPAHWERAWKSQMRKSREEWAHQGFDKVMARYWSEAGLTPSNDFGAVTVSNLGATMRLLIEMRSHIILKSSHVSHSLALVSNEVANSKLLFEAGAPFEIVSHQIETIEAFFQAYLSLLRSALEDL